ncbi:MAG: hypothetical protein NT155_03710 [Candidatus Staskawiczbacteria bacterium]|nr:hypothetical protein [Candidatus Staskawiczbacteria bacterium]
MPKAFDDCVANGGSVKTIVPEPGKYLHVCYPKGGGASIAGDVKTVKAGSMPKPAQKSKSKMKFLKKGK